MNAVLNANLLLALPIAFLAGLVSFASPCILPLVPGYLGFITGYSASVDQQERPSRKKMLWAVTLFVAGFSAVFLAFGFASGGIGNFLLAQQQTITKVAGLIVIIMGLIFLGLVPLLERQRTIQLAPTTAWWGAPMLGFVFGLGWTPCLGPTLVAINLLALNAASANRGLVLAIAYCLGLGLPFWLIAAGVSWSKRANEFLIKHKRITQKIGGGTLIILGILLTTGGWNAISMRLQNLIANTSVML